MSRRDTRHSTRQLTFAGACAVVDTALRGSFRQDLVAGLASATAGRDALRQLGGSMRTNVWKTGAVEIRLDTIVTRYDTRARREGLHALHDWDGVADTVGETTIPMDILTYMMGQHDTGPPDPRVLAMLVDYYFLHVLALLSLRIWDDGDPDDNLVLLDRVLGDLQGPDGSGQPFADDAATLLLIATCHYEPEEHGFDLLLDRVRTLSRPHRTQIALGHAASLGCHLRFGFEATYRKDTTAMRDDNVADYPWLCFALAAVMTEYTRLHDDGTQGPVRERTVEALLNGLSPDPDAFLGDRPPASLAAHETERLQFRERLYDHRKDLLDEIDRHRPVAHAYSPLSLFFNFSHNVLKGTIVDALRWGEPWQVTLNDLLTGVACDDLKAPKAGTKQKLATRLMSYARANPDLIRGRLMPVIVYAPQTGYRAFTSTVTRISA